MMKITNPKNAYLASVNDNGIKLKTKSIILEYIKTPIIKK